MKIWLLKSKSGNHHEDNPWGLGGGAFGCMLDQVVRAETEEAAREIAQAEGRNETWGFPTVWKDEKYSSCVELTGEGEPGFITGDYVYE